MTVNFLKAVLEINDETESATFDVPADPLAKFLEGREQDALKKSLPGVSDSEWSAELEAPVFKTEKPFANPLKYSRGTMGFRLRICRVEKTTTADGEKWQYAFNDKNEIVDARILRDTGE